MLAIVLRILISLEIVLYAALAAHLLDASPLVAGLLAIAALLGTRLAITLLTYGFAWRHRSPAPPLGLARTLRMIVAEWGAFVANFVVLSPFENLWMGPDRLRPSADRPPVLLVHGYGCSRAAWWWLRRRLQAHGWVVATINLEPIYADIERYVDPLAQRIGAVLAETGATRLILVGHSMGGLVVRAYLRRGGAERICRAVTLGTPYGGSELARLGFGVNGRQMVPGNDWLARLSNDALRVATTTIFSPHDNYVMPQTNLLLPGAQRRSLDGLGHLAMLYSPRAADALFDALGEPDDRARGCPNSNA
ncbi:MAG: alpha/beta fold hydrolase [Propionivibrio sp.]